MKILEVCFSLTNKCNFDCDYCYSHNSKNETNMFLNLIQIKLIIKNLKLFKNAFFIFYISGGGEPTLNPEIKEIIKLLYCELSSQIKKIIIISNGSYKKELYNALITDKRTELKISVHNFVNYKTFIYLIKETNINLEFYLMYNPLYKEKYKNLMKNQRDNVKFTLKKVYRDINKKVTFFSYSESDNNFIKAYNDDLFFNIKTNCETSKNFIFINQLGFGHICSFCSQQKKIFFLLNPEKFLKKINENIPKCMKNNLKDFF